MTDKVQKIREEVQRLQSELIQEKEKGFCSETDDACILELQNVLTYIDSLQEEPVFKVGDTIQKKDNNSIRYSIINKTSDGYRALRGLSDTIVIWFSEQDQWELVEEPVSDDLEEVAKEYEEKGRIDSVISRKRDFINGAKWQKQQMMKGAIDAKVGLTT